MKDINKKYKTNQIADTLHTGQMLLDYFKERGGL